MTVVLGTGAAGPTPVTVLARPRPWERQAHHRRRNPNVDRVADRLAGLPVRTP